MAPATRAWPESFQLPWTGGDEGGGGREFELIREETHPQKDTHWPAPGKLVTRTNLRGVNPGGRNAPAQDLRGNRGSCTRYKLGHSPRSRKEHRGKSGDKARILGRECPLDLGLFARPPTRDKRSLLRHPRPSAPASADWAFGMLLRQILQHELKCTPYRRGEFSSALHSLFSADGERDCFPQKTKNTFLPVTLICKGRMQRNAAG